MRVNCSEPSRSFRGARIGTAAPGIIAASLIIAAIPCPGAAQTAADSVAVRAQIGAYQRAWNAHDPSALAAFFAEDADVVMGNLPAARGRQAIQDWWQVLFAGQDPGRRLTLDVGSLRFLAAEVAVVALATTTDGHDAEGHGLPVQRSRGTWLMRRDGGRWLISALRTFPREEDRVVLNSSVKAAEALRVGIRTFVAAYLDAWNSRDPAAVSALYTSDADLIVRNSPLVHGRKAIQDWWRTYFSSPRLYRPIFIIDDIRMLAPNIALINITATGVEGSQSGDQPPPVRYARATWVIIRGANGWRISALWVLPSKEDRVNRSGGHSHS